MLIYFQVNKIENSVHDLYEKEGNHVHQDLISKIRFEI